LSFVADFGDALNVTSSKISLQDKNDNIQMSENLNIEGLRQRTESINYEANMDSILIKNEMINLK
jgi:hypothetical protein